ncbi:hypothetical protein KIN20_020479 [Parelaphostrongylus tenuis]|uniref:Uncharacterized protein n=1 Tax=Parelaphostrongylus tenuis TaxID=148309 RepID=A0AAD5N6K7_PARTN|nr:hypothetical protein KIN20_020479 [Parelaphostrongylus tenuis]
MSETSDRVGYARTHLTRARPPTRYSDVSVEEFISCTYRCRCFSDHGMKLAPAAVLESNHHPWTTIARRKHDGKCAESAQFLKKDNPVIQEERMVFAAPLTLKMMVIFECSHYVCMGQKANMINDLARELSRREKAVETAKYVVKKMKIQIPSPPFRL